MLLIGLAEQVLLEHERKWLLMPGVAGVILFSRNFGSREQLASLVAAIRDVAGDDFLLSVDQEGGPVQRFREGFTRLPALAKIGDVYNRDPTQAVRLAEEHAWVMASELRASGIDVSFAPVVDLARGNAAIGTRAFHADPQIAAELGQAYVRGMHLAGMAAILKHFPGHGSVAADTHMAQAIDPRPWAQLHAEDMVPFLEAFGVHAEAVMMAHVVYPDVDEKPAGFSSRWINDILRGELGFKGVVISDDISMAAAGAAGNAGDRVRAHLHAGCDLVLACYPDVVEEAIAALPATTEAIAARVATLRGAVGASWAGLLDNPQRERFVARITALDS